MQSPYIRNTYFVNNGWIVIRFSEEQILRHPTLCCYTIIRVVQDFKTLYDMSSVEEKVLIKHKAWSTKDVYEMINVSYRDFYKADSGVSF